MTGPFGENEEVMLARLQEDVVAAGVSYGCAMKMYATYLLTLLQERIDSVGTFSSAEVDWLVKKLKDGSASIGGNSLEAERQRWRVELWEFHDSLGQERSPLAAFVRCAVCCFYPERGWDADAQEDPTPIPLFLALLKKFDPNIGVKFLEFARSAMLSNC
jgi:hypothetical protein